MPEATIQTEWGSGFSRGLWRYIRPRFFTAGTDSFSDPPGQDEDMFEELLNVLPPVQGDIDRRWGYRLFAATSPVTGSKAYPINLWIDDPPGARQLIVTSDQGFVPMAEDGSTVNPAVTVGSAPGTTRTISSRGELYAANPTANVRWSPALGATTENWGIDIGNAASGGVGPNNPSVASSSSLPGWLNPTNCFLQDGVNTTSNIANFPLTGGFFINVQASTGVLTAQNFGFALAPQANIIGLQVDVFRNLEVNNSCFGPCTGTKERDLNVSLTVGGSQIGTLKSTVVNIGGGSPIPAGYLSFGSSSDTWGTALTPAQLNDTTFAINVTGVGTWNNTGGHTAIGYTSSIDHIRVTVFVKSPPITIGATPAGSVTLVSGRIYQVVFYNSSVTPSPFSDLNLPSLSTGPVTNKEITLNNILVSLDPQVDRKKVLATADGGDLNVLYELVDLPNATTTTIDNVPEASLLLANQYQSLLDDGTSVGVADNTPPIIGMKYPTLHRGRVYGLFNSTLIFSKSDEELFTPTGVFAGRFEESFPSLNNFPITNQGEVGTGLLSDGTVLYIGTNRRVVRLFGDGPNTFLKPEVLFDGVGVINQDVWKLVVIEGNPIGGIWLTPDYRVIGSDFNTYQDIGKRIQNTLNTINPAAIQTAWAASVNISVYNLYVLAVPTGANTEPDTLLVFDVKGRNWFTWKLTDTAVSGFWWVGLDGQPRFIVLTTTGNIFVFDVTLTQDGVGIVPTNFPVGIRTSWLALGDATARKWLNEIEVTTGDPSMTVTVEGASTLDEFNSPTSVALNAPLVVKPRGERAVFLAGSQTHDRYYRFTFNATDSATDLLRGFNIRGRVAHRE